MVFIVILDLVIASIVGLGIKYLFDNADTEYSVTWIEYAAILVVLSVIILPVTVKVGWGIARQNNVTFYEYWNGWETEAIRKDTKCTRDGACTKTYSCDPYVVMVSYQDCHQEGTGDNARQVCITRTRPETRYHSCPYVAVETTYVVQTTLTDHTIARHCFPADIEGNRWVSSFGTNESKYKRPVSQNVISNTCVGEPQFWLEAKARVEFGNPGPVTERNDYVNYLLASDTTIFGEYSKDIEMYLATDLLPPVTNTVYSHYMADKVSFVGYEDANPEIWQSALGYLNAGLGSELYGDMHIVIIDDSLITNPERYQNALLAYWSSPEYFGKDTASKNGIFVILGTDGSTITWARVRTGMPVGNEYMTARMETLLKGTPLTPESVIGVVTGEFYIEEDGKKVQSNHENGVLEQVVWGLSESTTQFERVSMGDNFSYLWDKIQPTKKQKTTIAIFAFIISCLGWVAALAIGEKRYNRLYYR